MKCPRCSSPKIMVTGCSECGWFPEQPPTSEGLIQDSKAGEYTLPPGQRAWITVGNLSVRIVAHDDNAGIEVFPLQGEDEPDNKLLDTAVGYDESYLSCPVCREDVKNDESNRAALRNHARCADCRKKELA